jgi:hypothetical protein
VPTSREFYLIGIPLGYLGRSRSRTNNLRHSGINTAFVQHHYRLIAFDGVSTKLRLVITGMPSNTPSEFGTAKTADEKRILDKAAMLGFTVVGIEN